MGNKYGNIITEYRGQRYDSRGEAAYAQHLDLLKCAGVIRDWCRGTPWTLLHSPTSRKRDGIEYTPDFHVWDAEGGFYVVDFKGVETAVFSLKVRLWRAVYPTIPLVVVRADGSERRAA